MTTRLMVTSLLLAFTGIVLFACSTSKPQPQAVYLVPPSGGQITREDLLAHPEVVVVHTQQELAAAAKNQVAIWIDKDAIGMVDLNWLQAEPQAYWPVIVAGYKDPYYAFREQLRLLESGPSEDQAGARLEPGFSVWIMTQKTIIPSSESRAAYIQGYAERPTVERLLAVGGPMYAEPPVPAQ